jgi:DNA-binding FrmR family transcriptional regulator
MVTSKNISINTIYFVLKNSVNSAILFNIPLYGILKEELQMTKDHKHENTKAVINRLSRTIGHLQSVKRMVEDGRDCSEILIQIAAVRNAINNTGKIILQDHINHCVVKAIEEDDKKTLEDLNRAIDQFMK